MAFPNAELTFARKADVSPASSNIQGLLDAIYTALLDPLDYRGTTLDAAHSWAGISRFQNTGVTESVYLGFPAGTTATQAPKIIYSGAATAAGTFLSPDTAVNSNVNVGITKNAGAYNAWGNVNPFTSGQNSKYSRVSPVGANSTSTVVRVFVSEETIFTQIIQAATTQYWMYVGAVISPHSNDTTNDAEADNRIYGFVGGALAVDASFLTTPGNASFPQHGTSDGQNHGFTFLPGTATQQIVGWENSWQNVNATLLQTPAGVYVGRPIFMANATGPAGQNTVPRGILRGIKMVGSVQSGRYLRNGGGTVDYAHLVSRDTSAAAHGLLLNAWP